MKVQGFFNTETRRTQRFTEKVAQKKIPAKGPGSIKVLLFTSYSFRDKKGSHFSGSLIMVHISSTSLLFVLFR
jgi:hypothetical protein